MFITCQECDTTYRLDERLLKPTGSKVRCSQCRHVFIAHAPAQPAETATVAPDPVVPATVIPDSEPPDQPNVEEQELEGIDLEELDALLAQEAFLADGTDAADDLEGPVAAETDATDDLDGLDDLDAADLDIDFEAALGAEAFEPPTEPVVDQDEDRIDLDMDFEIHDDTLVAGFDALPAETLQEPAVEAAQMEQSPRASSGQDPATVDMDIENDLSSVEGPTAPDAAAGDDLNLVDLDLDLDDDIFQEEGSDEMELSLDDEAAHVAQLPSEEKAGAVAGLDLEEDSETTDFESSLEPGLELELELELDDKSDPASVVSKPMEEPEALEIALDDDLHLEDDNISTETPLEEIELSLDDDVDPEPMDEASRKSASPVPADETGAETDADLDLDFDLDLASEIPPLSQDASDQPGADLQGAGPVSGADADTLADELDLSDLDALMTTTGQTEKDTDGEESSEAPDFELSLEASPPSLPEATDTDPGTLEDLDFHLDDDYAEKPEARPLGAGDTLAEDEIDLSDIEQMLEDGSDNSQQKLEVMPIEEDLGFGGNDEIDLAEIESAIEEADILPSFKAEDGSPEDRELELDFDLEPGALDSGIMTNESDFDHPEASPVSPSDSLDLDLDDLVLEGKPDEQSAQPVADAEELDLSDLSGLLDDQEAHASDKIIHSGDIELEFHIEDEEDRHEGQKVAAPANRTAGKAAPALIKTLDSLPPEEKKSAPPKPKPFKTKKKTSKSLVALLILALLGGGGYGLYFAVEEKGIAIPYVSDYVKQAVQYFNPAPQDPQGVLNLSTLDISSKFIENAEAGRLFVITGRVRNGYSTPRESVRVQGRLYTRGKVLAKTEFSYAGTMISDQDLAGQSIVEIRQLLRAAPREPGAASVVRPGQTLPFMLIFSDLPPAEQLDEFDIELVSSAPGR